MALASVLEALSIPSSYLTLLHHSRRDCARNQYRDRGVLETQKRRRRQLNARAITAETSRKHRSKPGKDSSYKSGRFGTEIMDPQDSGEESDTTCAMCNSRICPIGRRRKTDDLEGCDMCELVPQ